MTLAALGLWWWHRSLSLRRRGLADVTVVVGSPALEPIDQL